ncbi:recombinase family protein [Alphaproteobacteria bacterium LSUCC0719]
MPTNRLIIKGFWCGWPAYSTVAKGRCRGASSVADLTFNFTLTCRSPALSGNHYSEYQLFLYQTISEHREQGMTFDAIAEWMNKEGYLTVRGKRFRGAHVHSILKKRLAKEELLNREYPKVWSDFSMEVVDKTILMSDFGFHSEKK